MRFTYKEKQDILWSLRANATRLDRIKERSFTQEQRAIERGDAAGAMRADDRVDQARTSAQRLRALARRLETEL